MDSSLKRAARDVDQILYLDWRSGV